MAKAGDRVWVDDGKGKIRPGVVMREVGSDLFLILVGTGTPRRPPRVDFDPNDRDGKSWPLGKPTFFFATPIVFTRRHAIPDSATRGPCTKRKFFELEELLDDMLIVAARMMPAAPPPAVSVPAVSSGPRAATDPTPAAEGEPVPMVAAAPEPDE